MVVVVVGVGVVVAGGGELTRSQESQGLAEPLAAYDGLSLLLLRDPTQLTP